MELSLSSSSTSVQTPDLGRGYRPLSEAPCEKARNFGSIKTRSGPGVPPPGRPAGQGGDREKKVTTGLVPKVKTNSENKYSGEGSLGLININSYSQFGLRGRAPRGVTGELSPASVHVSLLPVVEACVVVAVNVSE